MTETRVKWNPAAQRLGNKGFTISELLLVVVVVIVVAAIIFPVAKYTKDRMEGIMCSNNLREVGLTLYIYAREHAGSFPPTLKALYDEQYLADEELMDCPATKGKGTPLDPDYIYTAGLTIKDPSTAMLLRDKSDNHRKGKNILYLNGAVLCE